MHKSQILVEKEHRAQKHCWFANGNAVDSSQSEESTSTNCIAFPIFSTLVYIQPY